LEGAAERRHFSIVSFQFSVFNPIPPINILPLNRRTAMNPESQLQQCVADYCVGKLADSLKLVEKCLRLISVDQIWHRPNKVSNSIGVLVLHLTGNVNQWINKTLGGDEFERDRPAEFARRERLPTDEILGDLKQAVSRACDVVRELPLEKMTELVTVQGYTVSGVGAVIHVVEHFSLHTGQIVYATKILINRDLSEYDEQGRRKDGRTTGVP
jgi:uncharacterized damage-inducible protein DinB